MSDFFAFLSVFVKCATVFFIVFLVLMALPQCRLRCVALEMAKWALSVGLILLTVSPLDAIPDVVPVIGWGDDIGYILGAIGAARSALGERKKRQIYEEMDMTKLRQQQRLRELVDIEIDKEEEAVGAESAEQETES